MNGRPGERNCGHCGRRLDGYRRQARYCGGPCRAAASRARKQLGAQSTDDAASGALSGLVPLGVSVSEAGRETAHKRTQRGEAPSVERADDDRRLESQIGPAAVGERHPL
jgi:hypothetical protein